MDRRIDALMDTCNVPEPWSHMAALMSLEAEMAYRGEVVVCSCLVWMDGWMNVSVCATCHHRARGHDTYSTHRRQHQKPTPTSHLVGLVEPPVRYRRPPVPHVDEGRLAQRGQELVGALRCVDGGALLGVVLFGCVCFVLFCFALFRGCGEG